MMRTTTRKKTTTSNDVLRRCVAVMAWHTRKLYWNIHFLHITILTCRSIFNIPHHRKLCIQAIQGRNIISHGILTAHVRPSRRCAPEKANWKPSYKMAEWSTMHTNRQFTRWRFFERLRKHKILIFVGILVRHIFCCCCHYFSSWKSNQSSNTHAIDADAFFRNKFRHPLHIKFNRIDEIWKGACTGSAMNHFHRVHVWLIFSVCSFPSLIAISFHQNHAQVIRF